MRQPDDDSLLVDMLITAHVNLSKVWYVIEQGLEPLIAAIEPLVPPA